MSFLDRFLARAFPSVPPAQQARCLAAMEGRTLTPAPGRCGEAAPGAGPDSAAVTSTPAAADRAPEGGAAPVTSPFGPPTVELFQSEPLHPGLRYELDDHRLAAWLGSWATEEQS